MSDLKDDKKVGCGISYLWMRPEDTFADACAWHDEVYEAKIENKPDVVVAATAAEVDGRFLQMMKETAQLEPSTIKRTLLISKAYFFWSLARIWSLTVRRSLWKAN